MKIVHLFTSMLAGLALLPEFAIGQIGTGFTISESDAYFVQGASPYGADGPMGPGALAAAFRTQGQFSTDHLYQTWWWHRMNAVHTREFAFANAIGTTRYTSMAVTRWTSASFDAELVYLIQDAGENSGRVTQTMRITNNTADPLDLSLFCYADFDLLPAIGDDSAAFAGPGIIRVTDFSTTFAELEGIGADSFQVQSFPELRGMLTDGDRDDLANTGLPFGPGDFSGAFQWDLVIPPMQSAAVVTLLRLNIGGDFGACCLPDGSCRVLNPLRCGELGGKYQGGDVACDPPVCAQRPRGACCLDRCGCAVISHGECEAQGGEYLGDGTLCDAQRCFPAPTCPCNWNGDGVLNSQDFFDFLSDLFAQVADFNCDGAPNSQDFFDFLMCFFTPPSGCA